MALERLHIIDQERANVLGKYLDLQLERYWNGAGRRRGEVSHVQIIEAVCTKAKKDRGVDLSPQQALADFFDWHAVNQKNRTIISLVFGELYGAGEMGGNV